MTERGDAELVRAALTGDKEAYGALVTRYQGHVYGLAYSLVNDWTNAQDIAQETFIRAYERWRQVSAMERPGGWLQRVAANLAISWRRRQRVRSDARRRLADQSAGSVPESESPDDDLLRALDLLTPAQRAVIVLRYFADQSVDDVARALGKRPGTVRALASQGLDRLRRALGSTEVLADALD